MVYLALSRHMLLLLSQLHNAHARVGRGSGGNTYTALKSADEEALEDLAGLVAVADVLEGLGGVLAADVEEDFFTAGVLVYEAWRERSWLVGGC